MLKQKNNNAAISEKEKNFQRPKWMILSVVIAIVIWVMVVNVVNPEVSETITDIPINFVGESYLRDKGFVIVDKNLIPDLSLKVSGTRHNLLNGMKRITVDVDVSEIDKKGKITVATKVNVPVNLSVQKQGFSSIELNIEPRYDKKIPVVVHQVGDISRESEGKIVSSVAELEEVKISGSVSEVESVKQCVVDVDVSELVSTGKTVHEIRLVTDDGKPLSDESSVFCANSVIGVSNVFYDRHTVEVEIGVNPMLDRQFKVEFDTRNLNYPMMDVGVLAGSDVPEKIKAIIPNGDFEEGEYVVYPEIQAIDGVYIPDYKLELKVKLVPLKEKEDIVDIELKNIPEGLKADKDKLSAKMNLLIPEDMTELITATIDCSEFVEGENEARIKFTNPHILAVESDKITIKLTRIQND